MYTWSSSTTRKPRRVIAWPRAFPAVAAILLAATLSGCGGPAGSTSASGGPITIAEPVHNLSYLPLYVGIDRGIFQKHGLTVKATTLLGGAAHTNAVLTGQAWGFIGGPEHNGFVRAQGSGTAVTIKAIAGIVNRGNVYFTARTGLTAPPIHDINALGTFLRAKTVVTSAFGGTPNSILRYVLAKAGLTFNKDVKVIESADTSAPLGIISQGQADVVVTADPVLAQGANQGIWQQPFFSAPEVLGPYAYSTINVREDSITGASANQTGQFVAALQEALGVVNTDHQAALAVAHQEFPNVDQTLIAAGLDRAYKDNLWEYSAAIGQQALDTALAVVRNAGVLKDSGNPATYADVVDMRFVNPGPG
jgi:NitT/TauT family transport system substrate-binding protein